MLGGRGEVVNSDHNVGAAISLQRCQFLPGVACLTYLVQHMVRYVRDVADV